MKLLHLLESDLNLTPLEMQEHINEVVADFTDATSKKVKKAVDEIFKVDSRITQKSSTYQFSHRIDSSNTDWELGGDEPSDSLLNSAVMYLDSSLMRSHLLFIFGAHFILEWRMSNEPKGAEMTKKLTELERELLDSKTTPHAFPKIYQKKMDIRKLHSRPETLHKGSEMHEVKIGVGVYSDITAEDMLKRIKK